MMSLNFFFPLFYYDVILFLPFCFSGFLSYIYIYSVLASRIADYQSSPLIVSCHLKSLTITPRSSCCLDHFLVIPHHPLSLLTLALRHSLLSSVSCHPYQSLIVTTLGELSGPLPSIGCPMSRRQAVEIINLNHWSYTDAPGRDESRVRGGP